MRTRILVAIAIVLAALGALAIRVVVEGKAALAEGDELLSSGKPAEAIRAFEASARWYLPLAPHVDEAYARLRELMASEDPATAMLAARAIRSAARATRSLGTPHAEDLAAADQRIAKLSARDPEAAPAGNTTALREAWYLERLSRDSRPSPGAAILAALGIVLWLGGFLVLVRCGFAGKGVPEAADRREGPPLRVRRRAALAAGAAIVVGFVLWAAGLYNA